MMRKKQREMLILSHDASFSSKHGGSFSVASKVSDPRGTLMKMDEPGCPDFYQALCDEVR